MQVRFLLPQLKTRKQAPIPLTAPKHLLPTAALPILTWYLPIPAKPAVSAAYFSVGKKEDKMGIRPSNTCELILQDVVIPEANRVGREGEGFRIAMNTLDNARPFVGAVSVGLAQAALDCAVKYAKERKQFGQPIASFQMIQNMIADMAMRIEAARMLVYPGHGIQQGSCYGKMLCSRYCYGSNHQRCTDYGRLRLQP